MQIQSADRIVSNASTSKRSQITAYGKKVSSKKFKLVEPKNAAKSGNSKECPAENRVGHFDFVGLAG